VTIAKDILNFKAMSASTRKVTVKKTTIGMEKSALNVSSQGIMTTIIDNADAPLIKNMISRLKSAFLREQMLEIQILTKPKTLLALSQIPVSSFLIAHNKNPFIKNKQRNAFSALCQINSMTLVKINVSNVTKTYTSTRTLNNVVRLFQY
jgi:hypothetical protein